MALGPARALDGAAVETDARLGVCCSEGWAGAGAEGTAGWVGVRCPARGRGARGGLLRGSVAGPLPGSASLRKGVCSPDPGGPSTGPLAWSTAPRRCSSRRQRAQQTPSTGGRGCDMLSSDHRTPCPGRSDHSCVQVCKHDNSKRGCGKGQRPGLDHRVGCPLSLSWGVWGKCKGTCLMSHQSEVCNKKRGYQFRHCSTLSPRPNENPSVTLAPGSQPGRRSPGGHVLRQVARRSSDTPRASDTH